MLLSENIHLSDFYSNAERNWFNWNTNRILQTINFKRLNSDTTEQHYCS